MTGQLLRQLLGKVIVISLIGLSFGGVLTAAESVQSLKARAKNHYRGIGAEQNYAKALQLYLQAAHQGDSEAQYIAGGMYFKGLGTRKDLTMAFKLLHQAALSGKSTPESQQIIGQAFLLGSGAPKDYGKAAEWYTRAAESGNREAQNELGFMYFVGKGVERDVEKGADYFLRAAYKGLAIAQYNVGIIYYTGNGFKESDLKKSFAWLNLAATNGHQPALAARTYLETILTGKDLVDAQNLSSELAEKIGQ